MRPKDERSLFGGEPKFPHAEVLEKAKAVARLFLTVEGVEAVGIFGSVARGRDARDIDMVLFQNKGAWVEMSRHSPRPLSDYDIGPHIDWGLGSWEISSYPERGKKYGIPEGFGKQLKNALGDVQLDLYFLPTVVDQKFLRSFEAACKDKYFIDHVEEDFKLFDPHRDEFIPGCFHHRAVLGKN